MALQNEGFNADHLYRNSTNEHGVWIDGVWNDELQEQHSFRLHDDEINFWAAMHKHKQRKHETSQ